MDLPGTTLVMDASCPRTQVALLRDGILLQSAHKETPAMESLLKLVQELTATSGIPLRDIQNYIYCAGPGSILGIRLSIMAIKTWASLYNIPSNSIFHFYSLSMAAAHSMSENDAATNECFLVCSEWKKNYWNTFPCEQGDLTAEVEVRTTDQLRDFKGLKLLLQQRKIWNQPPEDFVPVSYSLNLLESSDLRRQLLHPARKWEVYTPDEKQYATWSGERHKG